MVTTAGRASGTTATASATPKMNISTRGWPRRTPSATTRATTTRAALASEPPARSSPSCRGVRRTSTPSIMPAMRPISVAGPVATTTPPPRPYVTAVPAKAMFRRSPRAVSSGRALTSFSTGNDSPVSAASSACRLTASKSRRSAGTRSPEASSTTSPGTRSRAGTSTSSPPRTAVAVGAAMRWSASSARSARYSWTKPSRTANRTMTVMATASVVWPNAADMAVATSRMTMSTFWNCPRSRAQGLTRRGGASSLGPTAASLRAAAAESSPRSTEVPSDANTSARPRAWGAPARVGEGSPRDWCIPGEASEFSTIGFPPERTRAWRGPST